jgi:type II secretory pathway component PulK
MTPNWSASLVITILVAFAVVVAIASGLMIYAAKQFKKAEGKTE